MTLNNLVTSFTIIAAIYLVVKIIYHLAVGA